MRKWICTTLGALAAIGCMGCTGKTPRGEMVETPTVLTHVFDGVSLVPERSDDTIRGYYGIHDGAMQFGITSRESSGTQGEDDCHFYSRWFVRALPIDGGEPVERTISETRIDGTDSSDAIERDAEYVPFNGEPVVYYFGARTLYLYSFYSYAQGETIYSLILDHGDGTEGRCENLKTTVAQNGVMYLLVDLNVDDAGNLYIATGGNELYVLRPDLTLAFRLEVQSNDKFLNAGYDGRMYLWYWDMPAYTHHLAPIDLTGEKLGPAIQLPTANARGAFFGDGYDVYYYTKYGIYGYHFGAENGELVMNFQNSNATAGIDRIYYIDRDAFLLEYAAEYRGYVDNFVYYRKGADIDLSQVTVVDIASADYPDEFLTKITRFNRAHKRGGGGNARIAFREFGCIGKCRSCSVRQRGCVPAPLCGGLQAIRLRDLHQGGGCGSVRKNDCYHCLVDVFGYIDRRYYRFQQDTGRDICGSQGLYAV